MTPRFKVAVAQVAPSSDNVSMLEKIAARSAEAAGLGARLLLFPEALLGGYPRGSGFGAVVGSRTPAGRAEFRRYAERAIDLPGSETEALGVIARDCRLYLVVGVIERAGGTLYCTVVFFSPDGACLGKHRKRHIALEGRCFVLSANQFARRSHYAETYLAADGAPDEVVCRGGSCIVDPLGQVLAGPHFDGECVLVADVDRQAILEGKFDFDAVGHYARPDVFQLRVNESCTPAVAFRTDPDVAEPASRQTRTSA